MAEGIERQEKIKELCNQASRLAPEKRAVFLAQACAGDEELRHEIESLLRFDHTDDGLLNRTAWKHIAGDLVADETDALIGKQIGHYQIQSLLGAGGMGKVFLAHDLQLGRQVAIKFLPAHFTSDPERLRRFEQEARAASALNHENIITIHEIGKQDHWQFIVMEYLDGQTLRERMKQVRFDSNATIEIALQVTAALAAAHQAGIVHRDVKPENIMVSAENKVKVLDFGIAKLTERNGETGQARRGETATGRMGEDEPTLALSPHRPFAPSPSLVADSTELGTVMGTASYLSPEQARGAAVDGRTDLFSLGLVLFEMVSGHRLFAGMSRDEVLKILTNNEEPLAPKHKFNHVPKAFVRVIRKALQRDFARRYISAKDMLDDLEALQQAATKKLQRRVKLLIAGVTAALVLAFLAAWFSVHEVWEEKVLRDGHESAVRQIAVSPDGKKLVSVGNDAKVIVWDVVRRERIATLTDFTRQVSAVTFSPDGKWFAASGHERKVIVWDAERLKKVAELPSHLGGVDAIAFTPDGRFLITDAGKSKKYIWQVGSWEKIFDATSSGMYGDPFLVSPDSRWLISPDGATWDLSDGKQIVADLKPGWTWAAIAPDGAQIVSVDSGGIVGFWDYSQFWQAKKRRLIARYPAHRDRGRAIAYSPDGRLVASGGENIILWDAQAHTKLTRFEYTDKVSSLAFLPDGKSLVSSHGDGAILVWDLQEKELSASFLGHSAPVRTVSFSPDGKRLASASEDQSIILWNTVTGKKEAVLQGHQTRISKVVFSVDGQWLISADLYGRTIIWEVTSGHQLQTFVPQKRLDTEFNYGVAISPDRHWVATGFGVYDTTTGQQVFDYLPMGTGLGPELYEIAFSPDGRWLVGASPREGGEVCLWEVNNWQHRQVGNQPKKQFVTVAFSPDSKYLVTGEDEGAVRLWQVEPIYEIAELGRHSSNIRSVTFSPDGRRVASSGDDQTIMLWDISSRKRITHIGTHTSPVLALAFSPDGNQLVAGEHDKSVRLYTRHRELWGWRLE